MNDQAEETEKALDDFDMEGFMEMLDDKQSPVEAILSERHKKVGIRKVTTAQLFNVVDLIKGGIKTLGVVSFAADSLQTFAQNFIDNPDALFDLFLDNEERALKVITGLCTLDRTQIDELEMDELIILAMCEWRLNERFFTERVTKVFSRMIPQQDTEQSSLDKKDKRKSGAAKAN